MTTTTTEPADATFTDSRSVDDAIRAVCQSESTLDDLAFLLSRLGSVPSEQIAATVPMTAGRLQALCAFVAKQLTERWDPETRCAPPLALREVVREVAVPCGAAHLGCLENVLPWQGDGAFCTDDCLIAHMRSQGETWPA